MEIERRPEHLQALFVFLGFSITYVALSIHYAPERILNTDCSYQIFTSINTRSFFFQEARYGMFITQVLLVLGIFLRASMFLLIHIYSISFPLVYIGSAWLNLRVFKSMTAALATIMSLVISSGATFFHATTETHLLLVLGCLMYGAIEARPRFKERLRFHAILTVILIWILFVHPNALFVTFFVCGLSYLKKRITFWEGFAMVALCGVFLITKNQLAPPDSYDTEQYARLANWRSVLPGFLELWPVKFIMIRFWDQYIAACVLVGFLLVLHRSKLQVIFMLVCVIGFLIVTILTFSQGDSHAMLEKSYLPAIFMIVLLFSDLYVQQKHRIALTLVLVALGIHGSVNIYRNSIDYSDRLYAMENVLRKEGAEHPRSILVIPEGAETPFLLNWWATSIDALMLGRYVGLSPRTLFITHDPQEYERDLVEPNGFIYLPWDKNGVTLQNMDHFDLPEVPYHLIKEPYTRYD